MRPYGNRAEPVLRNPRSGRRSAVLGTALVLLALALAGPAAGQVLSGDMLYTSVQPCRVFDTRLAGGVLAANTGRTFHVVGSTSNFAAQGGKAGGCNIPGFVGGKPQAVAVMINLIAVAPQGPGNLRAFPTDSAVVPLASVINYTDVNLANGFVLPLRQDSEGSDILIRADVSGTHVVADVMGFFSPAQPRRYYVTTTTHNGATAKTACAAGFHMASLWEIFDTSNLAYDTTRGYVAADAGQGPPSQIGGWVRTGFAAGLTSTPGFGNCNLWTDSHIDGSGTVVSLNGVWGESPTSISPWKSGSQVCSAPLRVWCVED